MPGLFQIWPGPSSNSASWTRHVILSSAQHCYKHGMERRHTTVAMQIGACR